MTLHQFVQDRRHHLSAIDWVIYDHIQAMPYDQLSLQSLALACHVSTTTIFRFCQKLGLSGFAELKAVLKNSRADQQFQREQFQQVYHQIVDYIDHSQLERLNQAMRHSQAFYVFARSEFELRLAKSLQRIFFPMMKPIFILPSDQALEQSLPHLKGQVLWVLALDDQADFPLVFQSAHHLSGVYTLVFSQVRHVPILANERLLIPGLDDPIFKQSIAPYILALEMLYLKLQLVYK